MQNKKRGFKRVFIGASLLGLVLVGKFLLSPKLQVADPVVNPSPSVQPLLEHLSTESTPIPIEQSPAQLTNIEQKKMALLEEIFQSKDDNDPRMDQDLKNLSPPLKTALQEKYQRLAPEKRNERGTIAFLIGRELKEGRGSEQDVQFLQSILMEKPCLSLLNCAQAPTGDGPDEQHLEALHATTIDYPQLMSLRYLNQAITGGNLNAKMSVQVRASLQAAQQSPNVRVVEEARAILSRLEKTHPSQ